MLEIAEAAALVGRDIRRGDNKAGILTSVNFVQSFSYFLLAGSKCFELGGGGLGLWLGKCKILLVGAMLTGATSAGGILAVLASAFKAACGERLNARWLRRVAFEELEICADVDVTELKEISFAAL